MLKLDYTQLTSMLHPLMIELLADVESILNNRHGITSLYRHGDKGVHGAIPLRGVDIGCSDELHGIEIEKAINALWQYDPNRTKLKCCIYHKNRSNDGKHLHFQVHPSTRRIS